MAGAPAGAEDPLELSGVYFMHAGFQPLFTTHRQGDQAWLGLKSVDVKRG